MPQNIKDKLSFKENPWIKIFFLVFGIFLFGFFITFLLVNSIKIFPNFSFALNKIIFNSDENYHIFATLSEQHTEKTEGLQILKFSSLYAGFFFAVVLVLKNVIIFLPHRFALKKKSHQILWGLGLFLYFGIFPILFFISKNKEQSFEWIIQYHKFMNNSWFYFIYLVITILLFIYLIFLETKKIGKKAFLVSLISCLIYFLFFSYICKSLINNPFVILGFQNSVGISIPYAPFENIFWGGVLCSILFVGFIFVRQIPYFWYHEKIKLYAYFLGILLPFFIISGLYFAHKQKTIVYDLQYQEKYILKNLESFGQKNINSPDYSVLFYKKYETNKNKLFIARNTCNLPNDFEISSSIPIEKGYELQDCDLMAKFWYKKKYLSYIASDFVQEIAYHFFRNGKSKEAFEILQSPMNEWLSFVAKNNIKHPIPDQIIPGLVHSVMMSYYGVLDDNTRQYYESLAQTESAKINSFVFKRAGMKVDPLDSKNCPESNACLVDDLYLEKLVEETGYSKEKILNTEVFPLGKIKGKILVNGEPFTGKIELFRKENLEHIFALRGTISVNNGDIEATPVMVGTYQIGIRLDDYVESEKIYAQADNKSPYISYEDFKNLYEIRGKNLPSFIKINDKNLKPDLGQIEIWINEK